ncbi:MAG: hypothetical protein PGMFKBFP_01833 [Anaerolineales bacterium]|nr:hypothetical protein [Anaerolineales bacterium]
MNRVGKHQRAFAEAGSDPQFFGEAVTEENVVAQNETDGLSRREITAQDERVRQAARLILLGIFKTNSPLSAVSKQALEIRQVLRRADDQYLANPRKDEQTKRVVHHRFIVDRQQLFADHIRERGQACAAPSR